jgi:hypothetical protein
MRTLVPVTDRELWVVIRRALLMVVAAIENRFGIEPSERSVRPHN